MVSHSQYAWSLLPIIHLRAAIAQQVQRDLRAIGISVTIAYYSLGSFFAVYTRGGILATGNYDMSLFTYANGPEPDDEYGVYDSCRFPRPAIHTPATMDVFRMLSLIARSQQRVTQSFLPTASNTTTNFCSA